MWRLKASLIATILVAILSVPGWGQTLMLFGGDSHKVYLGDLTSSKFDKDSVWNQFGEHGNPFNTNCIWNNFGPYGGEFSNDSPFNEFASNPPVIVDVKGNFYGYFTANRFYKKRTTIEPLLKILDNNKMIRANLDKFRDGMP